MHDPLFLIAVEGEREVQPLMVVVTVNPNP
jgi:hypothetical protein